jgi:hypothetical protein
MEPINNLIGPIDGFHFKHGGNEFSIHKVLLYAYAPDEWQYARQKAHNPLASNQPWHARTLKRNVRREGHIREVFFRQPVSNTPLPQR